MTLAPFPTTASVALELASRTPPATNGNGFFGERQPLRAVLAYTFAAVVAAISWYLPHFLFDMEHAQALDVITSVVMVAMVIDGVWKILPYVSPFPIALPQEDPDAFVNDPKFLHRIGVVVPAHKSALEIERVLDKMLRYFEPEHIVVVDNANCPTPPDNTRDVVAKVDRRIRYVYVPQGHKTRALLVGTLTLPPSVEYVLHVDDDTQLSERMVFDESHFSKDAKVAGVSFGIRMDTHSLVGSLVDWEFVLFSVQRTFMADRATAFFCHGIVGLWQRQTWTSLLLGHPAMPYGEDNWIGCDAMSQSRRIAAELRCHVTTYAPPRLFPVMPWAQSAREQGYGASSVWKQRAFRWYTNAPRRMHFRLWQLWGYRASTLSQGAWLRFFLVMHILHIASALCTPFLLMRMWLVHPLLLRWLPRVLATTLVQRLVFSLGAASFMRLRAPTLAPKPLAVVLFPLYLLFLDVATIYGHWHSLLYYQPFWHLNRLLPSRWAASAVADSELQADLEMNGAGKFAEDHLTLRGDRVRSHSEAHKAHSQTHSDAHGSSSPSLSSASASASAEHDHSRPPSPQGPEPAPASAPSSSSALAAAGASGEWDARSSEHQRIPRLSILAPADSESVGRAAVWRDLAGGGRPERMRML